MESSTIIVCVLLSFCSHAVSIPFQPMIWWSRLEYDYATPAARQADINSKFFIETSGTPIDVDVYYYPNGTRQVFVATPRFVEGIPVTLGTVTNKTWNTNPMIAPFPDWSWQTNIKAPCNANRIVSVFRMKIDECGKLWVLDNGKIGDVFICPPQILAFDLAVPSTPPIKYEIPATQYACNSIFVTPIVDVISTANRCKNTFVYLADCQGFSIVVYDQLNNKSWRIKDKTFYPMPAFGTYNILGDQFQLMDGILGMDLEPKYSGMTDRKLFYHALSSNTENWVYTSYLKTESLFLNNPSSTPQIFTTFPTTRFSQSAAMAIDKNGIAYFGDMGSTSMMCSNTYRPYTPVLVEYNNGTLQFASGVKVITNPATGRQEVWIVTNSLQKVMAGTINYVQTNFRILIGYTDEILNGPTAFRCN